MTENSSPFKLFSLALLDKGYSFLEFVRLYNSRYGTNLYPYRLSTAIDERKNEHQERVADNAQKLFDELPQREANRAKEFLKASKPFGVTYRQIWERYKEKTGDEIALSTFTKHLNKTNISARSVQVVKTAYDCLKEIVAENRHHANNA